jgi:uncharacterized membrane protein
MNPQVRAIAKAITWRIVGSLDTFAIALVLTGRWQIASSISAVEVVTKCALYYAHEQLWDWALRWRTI